MSAISLRLVPVEPKVAGRHASTGFADDSRFDPGWWNKSVVGLEGLLWFSGYDADEELVRVEVNPDVSISPDYEVRPRTSRMVEITRIETLSSHQRRGYGRSAVREICHLYPLATLGAFSLNSRADRFWKALNWTRYDASDGGGVRSPLYLGRIDLEAP